MKKLIILFMGLLLLCGCGPGLSDWSYDLLPKDYEIWRVNSQNIVLGRRSNSGLTHTVEPYILEFCSNDRWIGAKRLVLDDSVTAQTNVRELDTSDAEFYLVDTETDTVHGPYTQKEYENRLALLEVGTMGAWIETYPAPEGADFS